MIVKARRHLKQQRVCSEQTLITPAINFFNTPLLFLLSALQTVWKPHASDYDRLPFYDLHDGIVCAFHPRAFPGVNNDVCRVVLLSDARGGVHDGPVQVHAL